MFDFDDINLFQISINLSSRDLTDTMKRSFFQAAVVSILLYGCTSWTLTKRLEKKLDGNYTRMLRTILNKSWRQHPTRHQLYGHLPPITKTIQVRRTRHAGHYWRSKDELISDVLLWPPHMAKQKQDDQLELTYRSYVRTRDVTLKTCQRRLMIRRSGERGLGISVPVARHDDDDIHANSQTSRLVKYRKPGKCFRILPELFSIVIKILKGLSINFIQHLVYTLA